MDPEKVTLLFGAVPSWADPDDPDDRSSLLADEFDIPEAPGAAVRMTLYETVANQIADEDPPAVWATAQRLLATGMDRRRVLHNLVMALNTHVLAALDGEAFDPPAYVKSLDRLPLPDGADLLAAMVAVTRERQPIGFEELDDLVSAQLGFPADEEPHRTLLDRVSDLATDPDGPLALLAGDLIVEPASLCAGVVLTHRLTDAERVGDFLEAGVDLAGLARQRGPLRTSTGDEIDIEPRGDGNVSWWGPDGWLAPYESGALLAIRAEDDTVTIEVLDDEPPADAALAAELRAVYDRAVEEPGLPVTTEDILLGMLVRDRSAFAVPRAPLSHLCAAAGLELRGCHAAHDESIWQNERKLRRIHRIVDRLEDADDRRTTLDILDCFEAQVSQTDRLRHALASLRNPKLLEVVAEEMLGPDDDPGRVKNVAAFSEKLLAAARRPQEEAVAHWVAALAAERQGDPLAGEAHLQLAVAADHRWGPAVDRLAWYCSDRGDAVRAAELWRGIGFGPEESEDMAVVAPFARPPGPGGPAGSKLGRNDPCWCGSGRKFKVCHLGQPVTATLPDRVRWLCRKAGAYLERRGSVASDVYALAWTRAGEDADEDAFSEALGDPLVIDVALHELGWFDRFLSERGPLLPEDEALLAASWTVVDRTVYRIVESTPGVGLVVEDLRSAEQLVVRERTFSQEARPETLVCGRALPDGETNQFIGGLFLVPPGAEADLLDLLDEGDPFELVAYVAELERPPTLVTREGEPLVACTAVLDVPDPEAARSVLDRRYERDTPDTWVAMHTLEDGDDTVRAFIYLEDGRVRVSAMSEERFGRVIEELMDKIAGARVTSRDVRPFEAPDPRKAQGRQMTLDEAVPVSDEPEVQAAMKDWLDQQELKWCDESIPALAGATPREAAADPTRRESLERLLASFEDLNDKLGPTGALTMRPTRLRDLLGLDA